MAGTYDFDLIVIGSGPAGEKGAAQAAYFGKKTAIIEKAPRVGGAGVNTGTVPSKTLREQRSTFQTCGSAACTVLITASSKISPSKISCTAKPTSSTTSGTSFTRTSSGTTSN